MKRSSIAKVRELILLLVQTNESFVQRGCGRRVPDSNSRGCGDALKLVCRYPSPFCRFPCCLQSVYMEAPCRIVRAVFRILLSADCLVILESLLKGQRKEVMTPCGRWSKFVRRPLALSPSPHFEDSAAAAETPMNLCAQVGSRGAAAFCAPEGGVAAAVQLGKGCGARFLSRSLFHPTYPNYLPHDTTPRTHGAGPGCATNCQDTDTPSHPKKHPETTTTPSNRIVTTLTTTT
jgi:hypothetical protein